MLFKNHPQTSCWQCEQGLLLVKLQGGLQEERAGLCLTLTDHRPPLLPGEQGRENSPGATRTLTHTLVWSHRSPVTSFVHLTWGSVFSSVKIGQSLKKKIIYKVWENARHVIVHVLWLWPSQNWWPHHTRTIYCELDYYWSVRKKKSFFAKCVLDSAEFSKRKR